MIRVGVSAVGGRMGGRVATMVREATDMRLACATERPDHPRLGQDVSFFIGGDAIAVPVAATMGDDVDVVIDFSAPAATADLAERCAAIGCAFVTGTTGANEVQMGRIRAAARKIPVVWSPNMSVGVNLLFSLARQVARILGDDYDVEIVEMHHRFKKDAPSGTARRLAEMVAEGLRRNLEECAVYGRHGQVGERKVTDIGIHAIRGGDVVGDHTVMFATPGERIELVHKAQNRDVFVIGALRAARWLVGRKPGMYELSAVLGL